ncbi:ComEC/Rec2 family competence protein [Dyadobacter sp. LHD-138]|uniref:ComEC/Rec2 family competence protein n=1 Tax=Dyadobacter sp. LHD-138 TaxID=3071413 RepID=UPI0027E1F34C|nr:ComEC/Rec2 family competence protein [Dyadobacter sp. LHD-138]MDQ6478208.1 ComEC/Rec2 family competence protein [Dyadobacter sp. LHD-138]
MLSRVPFVGLVLTLMTGILVGDWLLTYHPALYFSDPNIQAAVIIAITAASVLFYRRKKFTAFSITLSLFVCVSGFNVLCCHDQDLRNTVSQLSQLKYDLYQAKVQSIPEKRQKTIRIDAVVSRIRVKGKWVKVQMQAYLSIPKDAAQVPEVGDDLVVAGNLERPKPPMNPDEFDYRKYLWNKGVAWTAYLPDHTYRVIKSADKPGGIYVWSHSISQWSDRQFRVYVENDKSYGLVKAMLLGRRDDLRSDQIDDYTTSGTVHILSVSGMHVAVIFFVLKSLLGWLKHLRGGKYIYLTLITALLGFYALVTGLPPSVQRATLMCVVFVIAEVFGRKHHAMNTLALSAFIILLIDPRALFDVGFQLSYLAMTGIFLFYKPLYSILSPANWLFKYGWQVTAMSFAAQLATFPLSLYYFHQFPSYFWLVNPFVITFTNFLLPAALLLLFACLGPFLWMQTWVGLFVDFCGRLTNVSVSLPKILPGYLLDNLSLDKTEVLLLYLTLFLAWLAYELRAYVWLKSSAGLVALFVFYAVAISLQKYVVSKGVIHAVSKHTVVSFKERDRLYIYCDGGFLADTNAYDFHIKNYAVNAGVLKTVYLNTEENNLPESIKIQHGGSGELLAWQGKTIYKGGIISGKLATDYQILTSSGYPEISQVSANPMTTFLISGEVKKRAAERWWQIIAKSGNKTHDLLRNGALLLP